MVHLREFLNSLDVENGYPCIHRLLMRYIQGFATWTQVFDAYLKFPIKHEAFSMKNADVLAGQEAINNIVESDDDQNMEDEPMVSAFLGNTGDDGSIDESDDDLKVQQEALDDCNSDFDSEYERERQEYLQSVQKRTAKSNAGNLFIF